MECITNNRNGRKEKEGTFAQKMFVHLIRTIDELLRYAGFAHFEPLQVYVGIGLPDCLEKCYHLMNDGFKS